MGKIFLWVLAAIQTCSLVLTSCSDDNSNTMSNPDEAVVINCVKPDYLKAGDKVALISCDWSECGQGGEWTLCRNGG